MNDFTESELLLMKMLINELDHFRPQPKLVHDLRDKIQSKIDNYCDHPKMDFMGDIYGFDCQSCGRTFTSQDIDDERQERIINCEE